MGKVNTGGYAKLAAALPAAVQRATDAAAAQYLAQLRKDFTTNSRGGGSWPPLKIATIRTRRAAAKGNTTYGNAKQRQAVTKSGKVVATQRTHSILFNTGLLRGSLTPKAEGNILEPISKGQAVGTRTGIGGATMARKKAKQSGPREKKGRALPAVNVPGKVRLGDIARWHNEGAGHLPKRVILTPPNAETKEAYTRLCRKAINEAEKA